MAEPLRMLDRAQPERLRIHFENGAEWDVLNGIEQQDWPRIQQIVMEVNNVDGRLAAIERTLIDEGFDVVAERPEWSELGSSNIYFVYARRRTLRTTHASNES